MYTILYKLFVLASTRALIMIAVNNAIVLLTSISSERISCQSSQFTIILTRNRKHKRWYERWPWCWKLNIYLSREGVACCRPWIRLSSITSSNPAIVLTDTFKLFWKNFTDRQGCLHQIHLHLTAAYTTSQPGLLVTHQLISAILLWINCQNLS